MIWAGKESQIHIPCNFHEAPAATPPHHNRLWVQSNSFILYVPLSGTWSLTGSTGRRSDGIKEGLVFQGGLHKWGWLHTTFPLTPITDVRLQNSPPWDTFAAAGAGSPSPGRKVWALFSFPVLTGEQNADWSKAERPGILLFKVNGGNNCYQHIAWVDCIYFHIRIVLIAIGYVCE